MAHSSSGLGHHPLKVEIAGSNPACATKLDKIQNLHTAVQPAGMIATLSQRRPVFPLFGLTKPLPAVDHRSHSRCLALPGPTRQKPDDRPLDGWPGGCSTA